MELEHAPGGRHRARRGGFASGEAAREGLRRARELEDTSAGSSVVTVAVWWERWPATRIRLRPLTRIGYAEHIHRYLNPHLGDVPLEELTPARVREAFEYISWHTARRLLGDEVKRPV